MKEEQMLELLKQNFRWAVNVAKVHHGPAARETAPDAYVQTFTASWFLPNRHHEGSVTTFTTGIRLNLSETDGEATFDGWSWEGTAEITLFTNRLLKLEPAEVHATAVRAAVMILAATGLGTRP